MVIRYELHRLNTDWLLLNFFKKERQFIESFERGQSKKWLGIVDYIHCDADGDTIFLVMVGQYLLLLLAM